MAFLQLSMVLATFFLQFLPGAYSSTITVRNECNHPVWLEFLSGTGTAEPSPTGFLLQQGESRSLSILMMVAPKAGTGLAANSPAELKIIDGRNEGVACKSACYAFGDVQYCCCGAFATSETCKPSTYTVSEFSKNACPQGASTFTSADADDLITFCAGLSTRFNLIPNAAKPNPQGSFHYWTIPIVRIVVLEYTAAERKTGIYRNRRMLLGLPDANAHAPPSSNEKSLNLDKVDPQRPPSPNSNQPGHH